MFKVFSFWSRLASGLFEAKTMPAGTFERASPSAVAATPASSGESTPEKHRALSETRKVTFSKLTEHCYYSAFTRLKESSAHLFDLGLFFFKN